MSSPRPSRRSRRTSALRCSWPDSGVPSLTQALRIIACRSSATSPPRSLAMTASYGECRARRDARVVRVGQIESTGWLTGTNMAPSYAVVDGSNIATEGRSVPSLAQLDDAVRQFQAEFPGPEVIVVVDATFGHRIDPSERKAFDDAVAHAELVSPPAGAVGRGDAFLLRVAERVGAQVLSNDSFQEFHAEHPWLFDEGRLIGGKPVPGVGWIFTPRSPVRGVRSRAVMAVGSGKAAKGTRVAKAAKATKGSTAGDGPK